MFPWEYVDGLWATKSKGPGLIDRAISFQDFQPTCGLDPTTLQTDRRTPCDRNTARCTSAKRGIEIPCRLSVRPSVCNVGGSGQHTLYVEDLGN